MVKNKKQKTIRKIALSILAIIQILLLMNIAVAHSYVIHQTDSTESTIIKDENKTKRIINFGLNLLIEFLKIKQIGIVSADEIDDLAWNCCPEMNDGSICQDIASINSELCAVSPLPTKCEQVSECKKGCCFDAVEGLCTTGSTEQKCTNDGGEWSENENCLIQECQKGCCVLGGNAQFVTEQRCGQISSQQGFEKDFRDLATEPECLSLSASQFIGACIFEDKTCGLKTEAECLLNEGSFYKNYLCSHPNLNTGYEKQHHIGCVEGEDEIYWFDDHNNLENIYSSDKDASWNNGKLLTKEQSCNSGSANINSKTCGNCAKDLSSECVRTTTEETHVEDGNFVCKDLRCRYKDDWGNNVVRENGESWCVYDSYIGDGKDVVGSRHWKQICINGDVEVEECADYRGQVCTQSAIEEDGKTFSTASCVMNEAQLCISYNDDEDTIEDKCNENKHCMIKNINVDEYFYFDMCVPRYPRGFVLSEPSISCSMANQKCSVFYEKNILGKWKCKENCNCEKSGFAEQMNDLCISLGDCGSYVNYAGEGTDNIKVTGSPKISWTDYKDYSMPVMDQHVEPQDIDDFLSSSIGDSEGYEYEENDFVKGIEFLGTVSGGLGSLIFGLEALKMISLASTTSSQILLIPGGGFKTILGTTTSTTFGAFAGATVGASIGMVAGAWLAKTFDRSGDAATVLVISGGVAGGAIGYMMVTSFTWGLAAGLGVAGGVIILYTLIIGWGETEERIVEFTCMPWQAPTGESDCEKCNEDSLKPCTKYRCESLGQVCKLLNENTENPACVSIPYEVNPPVITAEEVLTEGYEFRNEETKRVEIKGTDGGCIREWTSVLFKLKTSEYAQCKYGFEKTPPNYEDMENNYPVEQNRFTTNHTFGFMIPSLDSFSVYNLTGDLKERFGNMNMYIRCQDAWENFNIDEYLVNFCINSGPDETAAWIKKYTPKDNSFLAYGTNETLLKIYLNEPAECRYDFVEGKTYEEMVNAMSCKTKLTDEELHGYPCSTTLTNLANENKFYIKCKDKPWVQTQEDIEKYGARNINQQYFVYTLYLTESKLKIDSVLPKEKVESGFEPVSVDLEVRTSGGIDDGKSACYYEWAGNWVQFFDTFSDSHKQRGLNLMRGDFNIPIKCQDEAGNIDYKNANFKIIVDSSPPVVVRAYNSAGNLKLITDEEAECYYDFDRCNFNINNATSMTIALSTQHTADWITGQTYYIKCKDIWGNVNPSCAIIVKPSSL